MTNSLPLATASAPDFQRGFRLAIIVGLAFLALSVVGAFFSPAEFFRSYLMSYLFWIGITLGSMAIVMLQYLTGGTWGILIRRPLESAAQTLPLLIVLFIPIVFGIPDLYQWAHADIVRQSEELLHRSGYMNPAMFILRAVIYFAIWMALVYFLSKWSVQQDREPGVVWQRRLAALSAPGLILYVFSISFAVVDWAESLEPHWHSTMWGFLFVAGQGLSAVAFAIVVLTLLGKRTSLRGTLKPSHFQDLGKLLLMWVMMWAYFSFSQLLVVWAGNLTSEIPWYIKRMNTSWGWVGVLLILFQFIVPFLLLLSRPLKRNALLLCGVVGIVVIMRLVDLMWIVMPSFYESGFHLHWLSFSLPLAIGGLWIAFFLWRLRQHPLLPMGATGLEALANGEE
jgi:hypothetical protein